MHHRRAVNEYEEWKNLANLFDSAFDFPCSTHAYNYGCSSSTYLAGWPGRGNWKSQTRSQSCDCKPVLTFSSKHNAMMKICLRQHPYRSHGWLLVRCVVVVIKWARVASLQCVPYDQKGDMDERILVGIFIWPLGELAGKDSFAAVYCEWIFTKKLLPDSTVYVFVFGVG